MREAETFSVFDMGFAKAEISRRRYGDVMVAIASGGDGSIIWRG